MGAKDAPAPRPNKKPRFEYPASTTLPDAELKSSTSKTEDTKPEKTKSKKEAELDEFMQVMQPRTKKERTWANNDTDVAGPSSHPTADIPPVPESEAAADDEMQEDAVEVDDLEWMRRRMKKSLGEETEEKVFMQDEDNIPAQNVASTSKVSSFSFAVFYRFSKSV